MTNLPPVADWVTIPDLYRDPFPIYDRLRAEGGVHWVPSVGRYLVTSYAGVSATEHDQETFSANEEGSLQIRAMGHSMLRRDDPEHYPQRRAWQPVLRPGVVRRVWTGMFERNADRYLDEMIAKGSEGDLIWDFAAPYAAECLREILGFHNATQQDLQRWSQTMINATGNYADDPVVWAEGKRSFDEVDAALDEMLPWHAKHPDESLLSSLLRIPGYEMPLEKIRANIKMTIGGGLNEPRDALGVAAWALLTHPEQRRIVEADPSLWGTVFDETLRWIAPIGLYSRQTTREVDLGGVTLPAGAKLGICVLSANRDESVWDDAAAFDVRREVKPHLAFSKGVHVCLGAWAARAEVADVGLPRLFGRLRGLELHRDAPAEIGGWVFRGMLNLPVAWTGTADAAVAAPVASAPAPAPKVAIVGSGPAGCFSAQALRRAFPAAEIDVFDEQVTPYGLVRYGVAADHQGTKSVARQFERLFIDEGVRFHGGIRVGAGALVGGVSLGELRRSFDAVVVATGMHADRPLGVPGDDLPFVHGAGRITRLLNTHPDEQDAPQLGENVVIVGHGNVAMDVARLLARDEAGLVGTDIDDETHARLAGRVRTIHLVGRSDVASAKFDPVMVRELAGLPGVRHIVHGAGNLGEPGKDARADAVRALQAVDPGQERLRIDWWFSLTPTRVEHGAAVFTSPDGETTLAADDVITAVGFEGDAAGLLEPGAHPDGRVEAGLYTAGWLRRGPRGTIPDQRLDARALARTVAEDIASGALVLGSDGLGSDGLGSDGLGSDGLGAAGLDPVAGAIDFDGWRRIDLYERLGAAAGRERAKLRTRDDLHRTAGDSSITLPVSAGGAGAETSDIPVTVLFGTESGGAEMVAQELERLFSDVVIGDLADQDAEAIDTSRLHLIVCATYGDGEVPTSARPFQRQLVEGNVDLGDLRYAVFGMGDRSYTNTYSRGSELIDEALAAQGASRIGEYGRHDAGAPLEATEVAREWALGVLAEVEASTLVQVAAR